MLAAKLSYLIGLLDMQTNCRSYVDVLENYSSLEKNSFDYAVLEKADSIAAVSYNGEWKDLGTWNTLTEVMDGKVIGSVTLSDDCENTHVINELDIPLVVMGAKDIVVAASHDGILVSDKEQSSYLKPYVDDLENRPMFEERSWGDYTVLNISVDEKGGKTVTKKKRIREGSTIDETSHADHLEVWTVLSGKAVIRINGRSHETLPGDTYTIPRNTPHSLSAIENTTIIEVQIVDQ